MNLLWRLLNNPSTPLLAALLALLLMFILCGCSVTVSASADDVSRVAGYVGLGKSSTGYSK